jgi:hypothetical protein
MNRPESINNSSDFHQSYLHSFLVINHDLSENNVGTFKLSKNKLPINGDELESLIASEKSKSLSEHFWSYKPKKGWGTTSEAKIFDIYYKKEKNVWYFKTKGSRKWTKL